MDRPAGTSMAIAKLLGWTERVRLRRSRICMRASAHREQPTRSHLLHLGIPHSTPSVKDSSHLFSPARRDVGTMWPAYMHPTATNRLPTSTATPPWPARPGEWAAHACMYLSRACVPARPLWGGEPPRENRHAPKRARAVAGRGVSGHTRPRQRCHIMPCHAATYRMVHSSMAS